MAARRKTPQKTALDIQGQTDPRAPLDSKSLLAAAQPVLKLLAEDLLARAKASKAVTAALEARHKAEQAQRRTADPFVVWQANLVDQVAAAWLLSCVFVRTLEDRGLLGAARLAGPGAADSQRLFLDLAPSLGERDYLLTVFRELSRFPAASDLFDAKHNPVWLLTPSAEAAKALLGLFRLPSPEAPTFRFGQDDTRFLGDLYQDLNEGVQKRYALLQTPRFVESFILDRTLERAIERFGLGETTVIDPTCGSGHFLLGSFERLFEHRLHAEPGLGVRSAAQKALGAVYGCDINPYAVAIARFRLTLAYLEKAGWKKLEGAPALPLHVVVADSLLHNAQLGQKSFLELEGQSAAVWGGKAFALEDEAAAREVLFRRYAAVVGNPPYITVKDAVLRERYREMYVSAAGKYSLAAPFAQRFFQLAREGGSVGMITANSFMKREFGSRLIKDYLPTVNLDLIINTSGAYIPGHGTPTVLLFGTMEAAQGSDVLAVLAKRGEPTTPDDAQQGLVWRSIADHWSQVGFDNEYVSVARVERTTLAKHPWSLGGGGASELKELLEERASKRLSELVEDIGFASFTGLDDAFILPAHTARTALLSPDIVRPMVVGESVRDWAAAPDEVAIAPYDLQNHEPLPLDGTATWARRLWCFRTVASNVASFGGKTRGQEGQSWWQWYRWQTERYLCPFRITFAFVATHNHFVLDRGGKVFKQSAPIIKLAESATEDDHLALLAYLNSSTACFWMKQVIHRKSSASQKHHTDPARAAYEFAGTAIEALPLIPCDPATMASLARKLTEICQARAEWLSGSALMDTMGSVAWTGQALASAIAAGWAKYDLATARAVYLQEEIDWMVYAWAGLIERLPPSPPVNIDLAAPLGTRPFEHASGYDAGVSARAQGHPTTTASSPLMPAHWAARIPLLQNEGIRLIESREFKRMWRDTEQNVDQADFRRTLPRVWLSFLVEQLAEENITNRLAPTTPREVASTLIVGRLPHALAAISDYLSDDPIALVSQRMNEQSVPYLAAWRHTETGLDKRGVWEQTWDLQRGEDAGQKIDEILVPPKYDTKDFRDTITYRHRGPLDVPKERFISYPGCESDQDREPVYGWAGWNHLQQAQALAALYQNRKQEEAWTKDRLTPMLAGLLELIPWIKQWHNEPNDEYGGMRLGDFFESFLEAELRALSLTRDDLRAWRPEPKKRGRATGKGKKAAEETTEGAASDE